MIPLGDRILVRPVETPTEVGGVLIPATALGGETHEGEVLAVGRRADGVTTGDHVLYPAWAGVKAGGGRLMSTKDVLAVIERCIHLWVRRDRVVCQRCGAEQ